MIFQNRRLILARKIVIEWRFHVFGFMYHSCLLFLFKHTPNTYSNSDRNDS